MSTVEHDQVMMTEEEIAISYQHRSELALDELRSDLRDARQGGFEYIEIARIESALIALAVLNGGSRVTSLESAIDYIEEFEFTNTSADLAKRESELDVAKERVDVLERILEDSHAGTEGFVITTQERDNIVTVLTESEKILKRVPRQQALAKHAISTIELLEGEEPAYYVPVPKEEYESAFLPPKGSVRSI